jgi:metal-responsive CopG/Arc/MetJ family transcriptional regulator
MSIVKTAVSLPEDVYERAESLARSLKTSRSRLYSLALEEYLRRHEEERLVEQINAAYQGVDTGSDEKLLAGHRRLHREVVEGEW